MCKHLLIFVLGFLPVICFGQGTVRGKITDKNGEPLIGAAIVLKSNPGYGVTADFDGNFSLKLKDATPQVLVITFLSFKTVEIPVTLKNNEVIVKDIVMESSSQEVSEVVISAKAVKSKEYFTENMKKKSATTIDYVSSETMKKTGDNTVVSAVTRVAGVSTNGQFITVRGIGDRYVKTTVNGSRIPTLDPFTNNIKLDLFPASLVDNVLITKTASPDIPGDWAGAYLSVQTKDYPDELTIDIESSFGYNNQSSFNEVISSQRSSTDWLGYDNNLRDHDHSSFVSANVNPSQYQQFVALGLGDYFGSMGVNEENWYKGASDYFKLGLVKLGLLAPASFNDPQAISTAAAAYANGPYQSEAFKIINQNVPASGKSFPANWNTTTRTAPLNFSQNFSIGNQVNLFGKPLGFLAGFRYYTYNQYDPDATANRAGVAADSTGELVPSVSSAANLQSGIEVNGWSGLINAAYKLNSNNSVSVMFMPNFIGSNRVRKAYDTGNETTVVTLNQFYEERKQMVYQLKTEHFLPSTKTKIEANASYTLGKSSTPDFKNVQYWINPDSSYQIGGAIGDGIHRYYRYLDENVFDSRLSAEFPIANKPGLVRKLKVGGSYQHTDQKFDQYDYFVLTGPDVGIFEDGDVDAFLNPEQFEISNGTNSSGVPYSTLNAYYTELGNAANHTFGNSAIAAAFVMTDFSITPLLRASGGVRIEWADIYTDVVKFDSLGLKKDDPRRVYSDSYPLANPGELNETTLLPSINLIYKLKDSDDTPTNLRLNYSKSIARPSIRELSDVAIFDYELRSFVFGNSNLKPVRINNYDLRYESYFKSGNNFSASVFYKDFKDHIELVNTNGYTWQNVDKSKVMGIELEGRVILSKHFEFGANLTLVKSSTEFVRTRYEISGGIPQNIPLDTVKRTMFGQAPYAVNGILTYKADSIGLTLTASYNVQGPRLVISSNVKEIPDVYELPRHMLDLKAIKTLGKHFAVSFTIKDILNTPIQRSYKYNDGGYDVLDYDKYTYGTNYILAFSYRLK